jgi:hypothetical protein
MHLFAYIIVSRLYALALGKYTLCWRVVYEFLKQHHE